MRPLLTIIERCEDGNWPVRETHWIEHYRRQGQPLLNRGQGGEGPPTLPAGRWARDYDACTACGRTDRIHASEGLCTACNNRERHRAAKQPDRPYYAWSWDYPACIECGTTERPHKGRGLCERCLARQKRAAAKLAGPRQRERWATNFDRCVICGTTEQPHAGKGLCHRCRGRESYRRKHSVQAAQ
jgi:hypothetical protein